MSVCIFISSVSIPPAILEHHRCKFTHASTQFLSMFIQPCQTFMTLMIKDLCVFGVFCFFPSSKQQQLHQHHYCHQTKHLFFSGASTKPQSCVQRLGSGS